MKTIEEKAKAYDEAIERAKGVIEQNPLMEYLKKGIEYILPELKESKDSEDEGIRKDIVEAVELHKDFTQKRKERIYAWLEKQGEQTSDKIVEKARTEKQRILLTETDGSANIDWDCRSLDDVKILLKCGLEFIRTIEANKQILTDNRFGGCPFRVPTRYDKGIKQGSQNLANSTKTCKDEQKPADKVKPKFKVGNWIINTERGYIRQILKINNGCYETDYGVLPIKDYESIFHLWTINDAKDGDVLVDKSDGTIGIFQSIGHHPDGGSFNDPSYCFLHCRYDDGYFYADFENGNTMSSDDAIPATKEQRDLLFQKMKEAGYEWDNEKKELKKIEQNPTWSEEDERYLSYAIHAVEDMLGNNGKNTVTWLKSLKERIGNFDDGYKVGFSAAKHNKWKPSDEQMYNLSEAVHCDCVFFDMEILKGLYDDLKKLRDE